MGWPQVAATSFSTTPRQAKELRLRPMAFHAGSLLMLMSSTGSHCHSERPKRLRIPHSVGSSNACQLHSEAPFSPDSCCHPTGSNSVTYFNALLICVGSLQRWKGKSAGEWLCLPSPCSITGIHSCHDVSLSAPSFRRLCCSLLTTLTTFCAGVSCLYKLNEWPKTSSHHLPRLGW